MRNEIESERVSLLGEESEVSSEKAAEMLRVSPPTLLKKLDSGEIPFRWVGAHRRISVADMIAYRAKQKARAQAALRQMRDEADELGLYE